MLPVHDKKRFATRKFYFQRSDGKYHIGTDLDCDKGEEVRAQDDGIIVFNGLADGFGSDKSKGGVVIIQHGGFIALYGHVTGFIEPGKVVRRGDVIGKIHEYIVGGLDWTHLHWVVAIGSGMPQTRWGYEEQKNMKYYVDPLKFDDCIVEGRS